MATMCRLSNPRSNAYQRTRAQRGGSVCRRLCARHTSELRLLASIFGIALSSLARPLRAPGAWVVGWARLHPALGLGKAEYRTQQVSSTQEHITLHSARAQGLQAHQRMLLTRPQIDCQSLSDRMLGQADDQAREPAGRHGGGVGQGCTGMKMRTDTTSMRTS